MLVKMAEALGRISLAGRELTRLAGYIVRINILKLINSQLRAENNCRFSITISFTSKRRYYFNFFHTKRVCIVGPSTLYGRIEEKMRLEWTK